MRILGLSPAAAHVPPSEGSSQAMGPTHLLVESPVLCALVGQRLKPIRKQAGCLEWP